MPGIFDRVVSLIKGNKFNSSAQEDREVVEEVLGSISYLTAYRPEDNEIIYHYCDANAFMSITQNRELWFSDVFAMNDFQEMHWGYGVFEAAASQLLEEIPREFIDQINIVVHGTGNNILPLICCFSRDGDVLSQWRAYAQDGKGYAIGFDATELSNLPARSLRIVYEKNAQLDYIKNWIRALYDVEKQDNFSYSDDFYMAVTHFAIDLCSLKNPGFREELEVRLVHTVNLIASGSSKKIIDPGGISFGEVRTGLQTSFRMRDAIPVPFLKQDFSNVRRQMI